ncbi:hypothetical protein ACQ1Q5_07880 [Ornithobacterium rhinotracheale]
MRKYSFNNGGENDNCGKFFYNIRKIKISVYPIVTKEMLVDIGEETPINNHRYDCENDKKDSMCLHYIFSVNFSFMKMKIPKV